jgi:hypothetical protein
VDEKGLEGVGGLQGPIFSIPSGVYVGALP